jgi:hypothetical protein
MVIYVRMANNQRLPKDTSGILPARGCLVVELRRDRSFLIAGFALDAKGLSHLISIWEGYQPRIEGFATCKAKKLLASPASRLGGPNSNRRRL